MSEDPIKSQQIIDLLNLSTALANAVNLDMMSREHAKVIWMTYLKGTLLDVPKKQQLEPKYFTA